MVSRYIEKYAMMRYQVVKHILWYVKRTTSYRLKYQRGRGLDELVGFTKSDLAGDIDNGKNTKGMMFYLDKNLGLDNLKNNPL